jgi:single-stranded DNA-binding protein
MISGNPVVLTGRVVRTPRRFIRPDGSEVVQFSFEPDGSREDRATVPKERVDVLVFGPAAGGEADQVQDGEVLRVEGRLRRWSWESPEGRHRSRTEIVVTELHRLSGDRSLS